MATKRPALSAILGAGHPITAEPVAPATATQVVAVQRETPVASTVAPAVPVRAPRKPAKAKGPSRRASGYVQLNVLLSGELRKRAKMKALEEDKELSEVIETLLEKWVAV
jgi:hypothetical protein